MIVYCYYNKTTGKYIGAELGLDRADDELPMILVSRADAEEHLDDRVRSRGEIAVHEMVLERIG